MAAATSDRLLPLLAAGVVLMLVFVGLKSCAGKDGDPLVLEAVPRAPSPNADTPADTIKTLTANVAAMTAELEALRQSNAQLRNENRSLITGRAKIEENVATRLRRELLAREHAEERRERSDAGQLSALSTRIETLAQSLADLRSSQATSELPVGWGPLAPPIAKPEEIVWIEALDAEPVIAQDAGLLRTLGPASNALLTSAREGDGDTVRSAHGEVVAPEPQPVFTVPRNTMPPEPRNVRTFHVFLASPGDMEIERRAVRNFFDDYNHRTARHRGLRFEVVDWEHFGSLGVGVPRTLISRDTLLRHKESLALVIGLMGQRFGTPTEHAGSGTEEELDTAIALRREMGGFPEIKWFFRKQWGKAGAPTDPVELERASEQVKRVTEFKKRLETGEPRLFYAEFDTTEDFPARLDDDLEPWLNDPRRDWNAAPGSTPSEPNHTPQPHPDGQAWLGSYLQRLRDECEELPLDRLGVQETRVPLPKVYVPLDAVTPPERPDADDPSALRGHARCLDRGEGAERTPVLDLLAAHRLAVVVGGAGSGKSVLVNHLTARLIDPAAQPPLPETFWGLTPRAWSCAEYSLLPPRMRAPTGYGRRLPPTPRTGSRTWTPAMLAAAPLPWSGSSRSDSMPGRAFCSCSTGSMR